MSEDSLTFRRLLPEDAEMASMLEKHCFSRPWSKAAFYDAFDDNNYLYIGAFCENKFVGMAGIIISFDTGEVTNVAVCDAYRGKGFATKIMKKLIDNGRDNGVSIFTLEVRESNEPAIKLYEKCGFKYIGKRPGFYEEPHEDALIYTLEAL